MYFLNIASLLYYVYFMLNINIISTCTAPGLTRNLHAYLSFRVARRFAFKVLLSDKSNDRLKIAKEFTHTKS